MSQFCSCSSHLENSVLVMRSLLYWWCDRFCIGDAIAFVLVMRSRFGLCDRFCIGDAIALIPQQNPKTKSVWLVVRYGADYPNTGYEEVEHAGKPAPKAPYPIRLPNRESGIGNRPHKYDKPHLPISPSPHLPISPSPHLPTFLWIPIFRKALLAYRR